MKILTETKYKVTCKLNIIQICDRDWLTCWSIRWNIPYRVCYQLCPTNWHFQIISVDITWLQRQLELQTTHLSSELIRYKIVFLTLLSAKWRQLHLEYHYCCGTAALSLYSWWRRSVNYISELVTLSCMRSLAKSNSYFPKHFGNQMEQCFQAKRGSVIHRLQTFC